MNLLERELGREEVEAGRDVVVGVEHQEPKKAGGVPKNAGKMPGKAWEIAETGGRIAEKGGKTAGGNGNLPKSGEMHLLQREEIEVGRGVEEGVEHRGLLRPPSRASRASRGGGERQAVWLLQVPLRAPAVSRFSVCERWMCGSSN